MIVRSVNLKDRSVTLGQVAEGDLDSSLHAILDGKLDATRIQTGIVDISSITSTDTPITVSFPSGFDVAPRVMLTPMLDGEDPHVRWWVSDITTTGCAIHVILDSGTITTGSVFWMAVSARES